MKLLDWMLWEDGDTSKSPDDILQEAISYYQDKYGCSVTHIRAPLDFPKAAKTEGVRLDRARDVLGGHLMLTHHEGVLAAASSNRSGE